MAVDSVVLTEFAIEDVRGTHRLGWLNGLVLSAILRSIQKMMETLFQGVGILQQSP